MPAGVGDPGEPSAAPRPLIGICAAYERASWSFWDMEAALVASTYLEHLAHGEAVPLAFIPSEQTIAEADDLVGRIDGLLLLGGADVDPAHYGAEPEPELEATVPLRDRSEIALVQAAVRRQIPVLGICRGLHVMNVATGGTLHQHIGEHADSTHRKAPGHLDETTAHEVEVMAGSRLGAAIGAGVQEVNSHHHQAVDRLGDGARVTAISPGDGLAEAVEWDSPVFTLGVQWHPEAAQLGGIIHQFIEECRTARAACPAAAAQH
ncbi:gamma-glutamyl-gamma-aminobutyrate hydrolase family protein [Microbacterium soli]|uniref:Gamma-glutamyl-gamma-aminobutyrate hydrolase family protein n=1 Tax=Microbacterium soli TaxID=446075 RepID=A0ABP7N634_9MICO